MSDTAKQSQGGSPIAGWLVVLVLAIPAIIAAFSASTIQAENRMFAQWPGLARTTQAMFAWPARVNDYVNDQFGLREPLIRLNNMLRYEVFSEASKDIMVGEQGWLFRAADSEHAPLNSMVMQSCGVASTWWSADYQADVINQLLDRTRARGFDTRFLIVPSALTVYRDRLPAWLRNFCSDAYPPRDVMASPLLAPANRDRVLYPLDRMLADRSTYEVYPRSNFHWDGETPQRQAAELAREFGRTQATPLVTKTVEKIPENIGAALIGVPSPLNQVIEPDFDRSGIEGCTTRPGCFGAIDDLAKRLLIVSRYRNPAAAPGKLVIVSDSFGPHLSGWMAAYYQEVVQVATNNIRDLSPADMQRLSAFTFSEEGGDILFLYNELNVSDARLITNLDSLVAYIAPPSQAGRYAEDQPIGFYPTNEEWAFGFARARPMFLLRNSPQARQAFVPGAMLTVRSGEQRRVIEAVSLGVYLHVFYDGPILDGNAAGPPDRVVVTPPK